MFFLTQLPNHKHLKPIDLPLFRPSNQRGFTLGGDCWAKSLLQFKFYMKTLRSLVIPVRGPIKKVNGYSETLQSLKGSDVWIL